VAGSIGCALLVGTRAMARWLGVAVVLWGVPLALVGLRPTLPVALVAFAVTGLGAAMADVAGFTLLARIVPHAVLARVYGVRESLASIGLAVGSILAPLLGALVGDRWALVLIGCLAPAACALWWRRFAHLDRSVHVRTDLVAALRAVPALQPLGGRPDLRGPAFHQGKWVDLHSARRARTAKWRFDHLP
jgi:MFS family permease